MLDFLRTVPGFCHAGPVSRVRSWLIKARNHKSSHRSDPGALRDPEEGFSDLLPMHLPSRSITPCPRSPRRRVRWQSRFAATLAAEWLVAGFSFWDLACPKSEAELVSGFGPYQVSPAQNAAFTHLRDSLLSLCRPGSDGRLGRGQQRLLTMLSTL